MLTNGQAPGNVGIGHMSYV